MRALLFLGGLLLAGSAWAQRPALPGAPQPDQSTPRTAALPNAEVIGHPGEVIGQMYSVETVGGILFSGTLRAATDETLTFETRELGLVTLQRANLRQLTAQTPQQARRGFDYVGNSTHMFTAPTARNLHQGEGEVRIIEAFFASVNYGLTDNISVGALVPVIPLTGVPFVALNSKISFPVTDKLRVGGGLLYGFATGVDGGSGSGGVGFGLATYGTADANVTVGLGYGIGSEGVGSTSVGVLGANLRVSRLFSVVNETYLANFDSRNGVVGLAGLRYAAPRFSGSLGLLYYSVRNEGGVYPAYLDLAFRFGKVKLR